MQTARKRERHGQNQVKCMTVDIICQRWLNMAAYEINMANFTIVLLK